MTNLEQLRILQNLMEDGILNQDEFAEQKRIVLQELNNLSWVMNFLAISIYYCYSTSKWCCVICDDFVFCCVVLYHDL